MITDELREMWRKKIATISDAVELGCVVLTDWETKFFESVRERIEDQRDLTFQQSVTLNSLYNKVG